MANRSTQFFDAQFARQIERADYALNPFERRALGFVGKRMLDLGCGLGNLALAAARRGAKVTGLDACPLAIADLKRRAAAEGLAIDAEADDLADWRAQAQAQYDTVASIGLLMFFSCAQAQSVLRQLVLATEPGGVLILNVLIEGTTYRQMFDPQQHCLLDPHTVIREVAGWNVHDLAVEDFPAGMSEFKRFLTVIARRPPRGGCLSLPATQFR